MVIGVALLTAFVYLNVILGVKTTIFAHALLIVPYVVLVMRARLASMDRRIEEAGRDLGSRPWRVLRTVTLPQILPALLGAAILGIAISLDELVVTNFTIGAEATIPTWIFGQMRTGLTPRCCGTALLGRAAHTHEDRGDQPAPRFAGSTCTKPSRSRMTDSQDFPLLWDTTDAPSAFDPSDWFDYCEAISGRQRPSLPSASRP